VCQLAAFRAFASAEEALDNILQLSESQATPLLLDLLSTSLPADATLGVGDERLAVSIQENSKVKCQKNAVTAELIRGVRLHFAKYVSLSGEEASRSQLGLGHSYSRSKVKFNVNRVDNMIIQSIALIDQIDKDLNTFAMRCREWYSWHFPELYAVVADNVVFSKLVVAIGDKAQLTPDKVDKINAIVNGDANLSEAIQHAAKHSMGMEIAEIDLQTVVNFAERVSSLAAYRLRLHAYLRDKMNSVAPNLAALIGEMVGARLISHAGSLTSLAKYPASTVQILGAEKALFRALKAKGNTPKYGLIFHSSFIGKASSKNKGRISRYLANKCSIASRLDCFSDTPTDKFGVKLREQVEERLAFYEGGAVPRKNVDVMREVLAEVQQDVGLPLPGEKRERAAGAETKEDAATPSSSSKKHKKDKKDKKKKEKKDKKKSGSKK
jgi:nucleolar protein 56